MKYDFDEQIDRRNTNSAKFDEMDALFGSDVMHLGVADMDYRSPKPIIEAMQNIVEKGVFGYTIWPENYEELVSQWMKRRYEQETKNEWVVFSPRINMALNMAVETFTNEGDGIVLHTPAYTALQSAVEKYNRVMIESPLVLENGRYKMDFQQLRRNLDEKKAQGICAKIMLLCNPHNPLGRVWSQDELSKILTLCFENDVQVVSDEIHSDLIFHGKKHIPAAIVVPEAADKVITCISVTKTFNLAGLQASTTVFPNLEMKKKFDGYWGGMDIHRNNAFSSVAMEAALNEGEEWLEQLLAYISGNLDYICDYFEKKIPLIKANMPDATYLVWLDCRALHMDNEELKDFMIYKAGLGLNDGSSFTRTMNGFMRLNAACPRAVLEKALKQLEDAVNNLNI